MRGYVDHTWILNVLDCMQRRAFRSYVSFHEHNSNQDARERVIPPSPAELEAYTMLKEQYIAAGGICFIRQLEQRYCAAIKSYNFFASNESNQEGVTL